MQPSHVMATGGVTATLTGALAYLSHWPWQPLSATDAGSFAGLIVFAVGAFLARRQGKPPAP